MRVPATSFLIVLTWTLARSAQTPPSLAAVVERASRFAEQQRDTLSNVRAEEQYVQQLEIDDGRVIERRRLTSEMAFVRLSGQDDWVAFRNVTQVDGTPTGADPAHLEKLFREGHPADQGSRIVRESAIYNLGGLERTLNTPVLPMHLLMPAQIKRFKIKKEAEESHPIGRVWVVAVQESDRPTIVRSTDRSTDVPIRGRLWVVPETGVVLRALLEMNRPVRTQLEFRWRRDETLDGWVPAEMRERYVQVRGMAAERRLYDIIGVATYSNYRRFTVDVKIK